MENRRERLRLSAGGLALVVAAVHLYWGIPRFVAYASVGLMPDPRPPAFVLSGHAIVAGLSLALAGLVNARRLYLPGAVLMVVHLAAYVFWHTVLAHGLAGSGTPHEHVTIATAGPVVLGHLVGSPLALVSKLAEAALLVLLVWLYLDGR